MNKKLLRIICSINSPKFAKNFSFSAANLRKTVDPRKHYAVVSGEGFVVCWHPEIKHPYEHSTPVPTQLSRAKYPVTNAKHKLQYPVTNAKHKLQYPVTNAKHKLQYPVTNAKHKLQYPVTNAKLSKSAESGQLYPLSQSIAMVYKCSHNLFRFFSCRAAHTVPIVDALWLGRLPYGDALSVQRQHVSDILSARLEQKVPKPNVLLMLEHNPVYTVGIRSHWYSENEEKRLRALGADFYRTDRGGLITFHGPGQLVVYPILDLTGFGRNGLGVRQYVESIELCLIRLLMDQFSLPAKQSVYTGVWVSDSTSERKIAAIGLRVKQRVSLHGLALNCNTDLSWFGQIVPCAIEGKSVTSISNELGTEVGVAQVIEPFCKAFEKQFECVVNLPQVQLPGREAVS